MLYNFLAGFLGFLFITISKMQSLKTDAEKANLTFVYKEYFKKDLLSIVLSFLSLLIWQLLFNEVAVKYPAITSFVRISYFVMGAFGSWIVQAWLSKTKQWVRGVVDDKTNELDAIKQQQ